MNSNSLLKTLTATAALFVTSLLPTLASAAEPGAYIGAGFFGSRLNYDAPVENNLTARGFDIDRSGLGLKVFGGYQFNQNFAVEGHYAYQGDYEVQTGAGAADKQDLWTIGVAGIASVPIGEVTSFYAKVGLAYWDGLDFDNSSPSPRPNSDGEDIFYGVGFQVTDAWRFEWERYEHDDFDSDVFSINYIYRFYAR